ncbi:hypothetical protein SELMODRAFT_132289 [Selaginella moellendorffii]|uniref:Pentacotripeptide-repeat region of PRORP domain-containing protein n=1 Tax=Selaginella moellendorffii TaxID=88036 RepID=D8T578_SELML|nr:hypothetical protein SELMODRAFT_132289 [Selaginella moellendorffii]
MVACVERSGVAAEASTYARLLQACARLKALSQGQRIHAHILSSHSSSGSSSTLVLNHLINMYGKCGRVEEARAVFASMEHPNLVSWNTIIAAHAAAGDGRGALAVFRAMQLEASVVPDRVSFTSVANACGSAREARIIHASVAARGFLDDVIVCTALITAYCRCGSLGEARATFDAMAPRARNVVTWTALIAGYAQSGHLEEALDLFWSMAEHDGGGGETWSVAPNAVTIVTVVNLCAEFAALDQGKAIHDRCIHAAAIRDDPVQIGTSLVTMYAKCGSIEDARLVFDSMAERNEVSWNAMLSGYSQHGHGAQLLHLFRAMLQGGVQPNAVTLLPVVNACSSLAQLRQADDIHGRIVLQSRDTPALSLRTNAVVGCALCSMYARCGSIDEAAAVFAGMEQRNVVSWNAMIGAYAQHGRGRLALAVFGGMQQHGVKPDAITLISVLDACAGAGDARRGSQVHGWSLQLQLRSAALDNAAVNMYAKSGRVAAAREVFEAMDSQRRTIMSWSAMVAAYAGVGHAEEAFRLFHAMQREGVRPNHVTLISILGACSHAGMLQAGCSCFASMAADYGVWPREEHTGCVVDMLGRAGWVEQAHRLVQRSGAGGGGGDAQAWMAVLGACSQQGDTLRGTCVASSLIARHPQAAAAAYVALSNSKLAAPS